MVTGVQRRSTALRAKFGVFRTLVREQQSAGVVPRLVHENMPTQKRSSSSHEIAPYGRSENIGVPNFDFGIRGHSFFRPPIGLLHRRTFGCCPYVPSAVPGTALGFRFCPPLLTLPGREVRIIGLYMGIEVNW